MLNRYYRYLILLFLLIPPVCFGGSMINSFALESTGGSTYLGHDTPGATEDSASYNRCILITPSSDVSISYGWYYGNTTDGGTNGTIQMYIMSDSSSAPATPQVGACSSIGDIIDGSSPDWNEVTWTTPIELTSGTTYWICHEPSESVDYYYDDGSAYYGDEVCGGAPASASSREFTIGVADYDAK